MTLRHRPEDAVKWTRPVSGLMSGDVDTQTTRLPEHVQWHRAWP